MAVYVSRRRKVEEALNVEVVSIFVKMVKSRLLVKFVIYRNAHDLQIFQTFWGYGGVLCSTIFKLER